MFKPGLSCVLPIWKSARSFSAKPRFQPLKQGLPPVNVDSFKHIPRLSLRLPAQLLQPLNLYGVLFALAILSFTLKQTVLESIPALAWLLSIASCVTCGLAWLLSRALFKPPGPRPLWPPLLVAGQFALTAALILLETWLPNLHTSNLIGMLNKLVTLFSSTVLLLPLVEATEGLRAVGDKKEQGFRLIYAAGYSLLLLTSLAASLPALAPWQGEIKTYLAIVALLATARAMHYRLGHPLLEPAQNRQRKKIQPLEIDPTIAHKVKTQLEQHQIFLDAEIKVAGLAQLIGEQEYKVTQCITGDLQFRNFNHMVNTYRIAHAQTLLANPACADSSILTIAMESWFNSLGPFNRAFKALVGKTPSEYRSEVAAN